MKFQDILDSCVCSFASRKAILEDSNKTVTTERTFKSAKTLQTTTTSKTLSTFRDLSLMTEVSTEETSVFVNTSNKDEESNANGDGDANIGEMIHIPNKKVDECITVQSNGSKRKTDIRDDNIPRQILLHSRSNEEYGTYNLRDSPACSPKPKKKTNQEKLREFQRRDEAIGRKRRDEIEKARKQYQPGTRVSMPRSLPKQDDDYSISSISSRLSSSSFSKARHSISSSTSKHPPTSLLAIKLREIDRRRNSTTKRVSSDSRSLQSSSSGKSSSLKKFSERDREIGRKRKEQLERARAAAKPPSMTLPNVETRDAQKRPKHTIFQISDDNSTKSLPTYSQSARIEHLYAIGKQKRRTELIQTMHSKMITLRNERVSPISRPASNNLSDLQKRNKEISMRRREEIAKARAASKTLIRDLPDRNYDVIPLNRKPIFIRD
jgi:hypothetical protein